MNKNLKIIKKLLDDLFKEKDHIILTIDGMACSGKTTLSEKLKEYYDVRVIHMDHFFLPKNLRTEDRFLIPGGNVHFERFKEEVLPNIHSDIEYRHFNCSLMNYDKILKLPFKKLTIVEGSYSAHPIFSKYYDFLIYMSIDYDKQLERIKHRDGEFILNKFINEWLKYEKLYFETYNIDEIADVLIKDFSLNEE